MVGPLVLMNKLFKVKVTCCLRLVRNDPKMLEYANEHIMSEYSIEY